jgi:hypothetical protein
MGLVSTEGASFSLWTATAVMIGPHVGLSALSAAGSLILARRAQDRASLGAGEVGSGPSRELREGTDASFQTRTSASTREREH